MYKVILTKQALKDLQKLKGAHLSGQAKKIAEIVSADPFQNPPPYEKLIGNLRGHYSRRINIQHRFVYKVSDNKEDEMDKTGNLYEGIVHVLCMWTHYDNLRV